MAHSIHSGAFLQQHMDSGMCKIKVLLLGDWNMRLPPTSHAC
jgi:hypothetical protein